MFLGKKIGQVVILFFIEHVKAEIWLFFFFFTKCKNPRFVFSGVSQSQSVLSDTGI